MSAQRAPQFTSSSGRSGAERTLRILMSEGSSLSAREAVTALGLAGFRVDVVDPNPLCLARFSKWRSRVYSAPKFGAAPAAYLQRILELLTRERYDVLYPAHEQAYLFARFRELIETKTALALTPFSEFERMQSKVGFASVLAELGLPGAPTVIVHELGGLREASRHLPVYVKAAFGTANRGTFHVRTADDLRGAIAAIEDVVHEGVLVQKPIEGRLGRTQAVFAAGRLVGFHACVQIEEGVGGGDLVKESIAAPLVREQVEQIGKHLGWHGGLSLDFICDASGQPHYIDSNPRLAETGNGLAAGVNLPELLVRVSLGQVPSECLVGPSGVRSFMGIQGLLKAAKTSGSRLQVARTLRDLVGHRRLFSIGSEELIPTSGDVRSALPIAVVAGALIANPKRWASLSSSAVEAYAATPRVVAFVRGAAEGQWAAPKS